MPVPVIVAEVGAAARGAGAERDSTARTADNAPGGPADTDRRPTPTGPGPAGAETNTSTVAETLPSTVTFSGARPTGRFAGNRARMRLLETASASACSPATVIVVFSAVPKSEPTTYPIDPGLTVNDNHWSLKMPATVGICACTWIPNATAAKYKLSLPIFAPTLYLLATLRLFIPDTALGMTSAKKCPHFTRHTGILPVAPRRRRQIRLGKPKLHHLDCWVARSARPYDIQWNRTTHRGCA